MGIIALICALILICVIPNEIWSALIYLGFVLCVAFVGWLALMMWLIG